MHASPAHAPTDNTSSLRGVLVPFAAVSAFLALIQVLCLGLSVTGARIGQPLAILMLLVAVAAAAWFAARVRSDLAGTFADESRVASPGGLFGRVLSGLVMVVLLWAAWVWFDLLRLAWYRPPYFWDSLVYHIPAINDWVQQGRVGFVRSVPDIPFVNYPMGVEVTAFLVHQATGTSRLVDASNLWYWPLGVTALAVLAAEFGAQGMWRWLAGGLLCGAPTFVAQSATAYVDAGFATTVMGSLAAACLFASPAYVGRLWPPILLGLNVGMMAGAKGSGLAFGLVTVAAASAMHMFHRGPGRLRATARVSCGCTAVALAVGGYWYVRNGLVTGNPLYPFRLQIGHKVLSEGFDRRFLDQNIIPALSTYPEWAWRFVAWLQPDAPIHGPYTAGGLGYVWIAGALPSLVYLWFTVVRQRRWQRLQGLALATVVVAVLSAIQPVPWQARFTLWLHGLGLPCLAAVLHDAVRRWRSRRGHLVTAALGLAVVAGAVWESQRTLLLEWSTYRLDQAERPAPVFQPTLEVYFPGLTRAVGFEEFLSARTVGRGWWRSSFGTFLGGVLAMPLGTREILVTPPPTLEEIRDPYRLAMRRRAPDASDIAKAQTDGVEWFLWESPRPDDIPASLAQFDARYAHRVGDQAYFVLVRIGSPAPTPETHPRAPSPR